MAFMVEHPLGTAAVGTLFSLGLAAWILRWEFRHQMRARRRGGFLIGGER